MNTHRFLFTDSQWIGEGRITFSASPDHVRFYTRWSFQPQDEPTYFKWFQEVEMQGADEKVENRFHITPLTETTFSISLENDVIGKGLGKGIISPTKIAWEIKSLDTFQGFEVYEIQENGDYMLHAEYAAQDGFRTIIDARIWEKK